MKKICDALQSTSGELLGDRCALDAAWDEIDGTRYEAQRFLAAAQLLASAQTDIDKARALLGEL